MGYFSELDIEDQNNDPERSYNAYLIRKNKMSRKKFIEKHGATCDNFNWSWSFINEDKKFIIFGAWDIHTDQNKTMIFDNDWQIDDQNHKRPGFKQSKRHIGLIENEGYVLYTFPMIHSDDNKNEDGLGPAKLERIIHILTKKELIHDNGKWFAVNTIEQNLEIDNVDDNDYYEGAVTRVTVNRYERSTEARDKCLAIHGYSCSCCGFDFEKMYGPIGKHYIHVHHLTPISEIREEYIVDPKNDLIPLCPNCHFMIHRPKEMLTVYQLKEIMMQNLIEGKGTNLVVCDE